MILYLAGASFLIAHTINAVIAEALLVPTGSPVSSAHFDAGPPVGGSATTLAEQVRTSGLFPLPSDPTARVQENSGTAVAPGIPRQPLNLAAKVKLLGVVMGDHGGVSAIVEMVSSKQQLFTRLHEQIPDVGQVIEIRRDGIVVRQDGQQELLELNGVLGDKPPMPAASVKPVVQTAPGAPVRKAVDRREVDQALNDLPKLLSQARAAPLMLDGVMRGFRLDYIAPGSFYEKIGLQLGDVLKQVNGVEIKDPGTMLTLFQQLRNEASVKLDIIRNNQRTTMAYEIR